MFLLQNNSLCLFIWKCTEFKLKNITKYLGGSILKNSGLGSLIIRLVLGIIFFVHGLKKFLDGIENSVAFFESNGLPGILAYPIGVVELVGGILLFFGLGTRIIAVAFSIIMIGAMLSVNIKLGFTGGFEFSLALFAMSLYLFLSNNQFLAADNLFVNREKKSENL
jgi:putative oxidoreductase